MNRKLRDLPAPQGLYDPAFEHDACGIGFVVNIKGEKSYSIIDDALKILENLNHRGAEGASVHTFWAWAAKTVAANSVIRNARFMVIRFFRFHGFCRPPAVLP